MKRLLPSLTMFAALLLVFGCQGDKEEASEQTAATEEAPMAQKAPEPDYITVQHILVGFKGSLPGRPVTRTQEEAEKLAGELLQRARAGEDFDALVKEYTDDAHPGIYKMANIGVEANMAERVFARKQMVAAFGDVGFPLAVGEIGMAPYDKVKSPYGWHIIKRIE